MATDLRDFSAYIQNFGHLSETNQTSHDPTTSPQTSQQYFSASTTNSQNFISAYDPHASIQPRQRQTWDRTTTAIPYNFDLYSSPRIAYSQSNPATDRTPAPRQPAVAFNVGFATTTAPTSSLLRRQEHQPARINSPRIALSDAANDTSPRPPRLVRSNTFVIENENTENERGKIKTVAI